MNDKPLTLKQAAEIAKCNDSTLRHAIRKGDLKATKFGTTWTVERADLETWIAADIHKRGPKIPKLGA